MYFNVFVLSVVLFSFPACKSECSSFYILIQEYFDDAFNVSSLKPVSDLHPRLKLPRLRVLNENINWENYTLKFNNNNLKDFRKECVILLNCNEIEVDKCDPHVSSTKRVDFETSTINTSTATENNDPSTTTEMNAVSTTIKEIANETIESSTHETTDGNSNNETTDKTIEDCFKINKTHESFTLGHVDGEPTGKSEDNAQHNKALAGKIAAGVVAAVVSVIATFALKKCIMGYLQSGVYHMPAA